MAQMPGAISQLTHVQSKVTGVIPAPLEDVWAIVRNFGGVGQWLLPVQGSDVKSQLLPGQTEGQVGALRLITIGASSYVEQLEALDDDIKNIKWKLISHPLNTNPFSGTFLNNKANVLLLEITRTNSTYMSWSCDFDTEYAGAEQMKVEIQARIESGFDGLAAMVAPRSPTTLLSNLSINSAAVPAAPIIGSLPPHASSTVGSPPRGLSHQLQAQQAGLQAQLATLQAQQASLQAQHHIAAQTTSLQAGFSVPGVTVRPGGDSLLSAGLSSGPGIAGVVPLSAVSILPASGSISLSAIGSLPLGAQGGVPSQQDSGSFTFPSRVSQDAPSSQYGGQRGHMQQQHQQQQQQQQQQFTDQNALYQQQHQQQHQQQQQQFTDQNALYQQQQLELLLAAQRQQEDERRQSLDSVARDSLYSLSSQQGLSIDSAGTSRSLLRGGLSNEQQQQRLSGESVTSQGVHPIPEHAEQLLGDHLNPFTQYAQAPLTDQQHVEWLMARQREVQNLQNLQNHPSGGSASSQEAAQYHAARSGRQLGDSAGSDMSPLGSPHTSATIKPSSRAGGQPVSGG